MLRRRNREKAMVDKMQQKATPIKNRKKPVGYSKQPLKLTLIGGIVFWVTTIATSLLPIAAQYRAAFSNWSIYTVWIGSLFMGMINGFLVSWLLLWLHAKFPNKKVIGLSAILSLGLLLIAILLVDLPMFLQGTRENLGYFFVGISFNLVRFLLLGLAIGYSLVRTEK